MKDFTYMAGCSSLEPDEFEQPSIAAKYKDAFDEYIRLRIEGYLPAHCLTYAFYRSPGDTTISHCIPHIERSAYVRQGIKARLTDMQLEQLWNRNVSIWEMLQIVRDPFARDSTRLNAIRELNVVAGITAIDPNGKTVPGLDHFYARGKDPLSQAIQSGNTTH